jgi:hypothetical protein
MTGQGLEIRAPELCGRAPQHNVDLSLRKNTRLTERAGLEFRAEFFNALNSTEFGKPDTTFTDGPAFGHITSTSVAPRVGQLP